MRFRRATGIETALFDSVTEESPRHKHKSSRETFIGAVRNRIFLGAAQKPDVPAGKERRFDSKKELD
jgi:hypothetical protein